MRKLFSSDKSQEVALLKTLLEEARIPCQVLNDTIPYPGPLFYPELWVVNDEDFARACELRDEFCQPPPVPHGPWTCPACGEVSEGQFTSCWKCGANRDGAA